MIKQVSIGAVVVGVIILVIGVVIGWVVAPKLIENKVEDETRLVNGTDIFEKWVDIPVPIFLKFYFFNVTNYQDFLSGTGGDWSAKPKLQQVGPYVYKERRVKYEINHNDLDGTVKFRQNTTYTFVPELSVGTENDRVNIINVPLISVATVIATMKDLPLPPKAVLQMLLGPLSQERYIKTDVPVKEAIFGWRLNSVYDLVVGVATALNITFPPEMQHGHFGFYLDRNASNADGLWEVYTGAKDSSQFSIIKSINGENRLDEWWMDHCAMINGTDATMFPPFIEKGTILYSYIPEICRSVWLVYKKEIEYEGIPGYRFEVPAELFTSPYVYEPNMCFCMPVPEPLNNTCDFTGGGRIFSCKSGAPIVISKPHFLDADAIVLDLLEGMDPKQELHDTYVDIEPNTGFPLRANKRLQIGLETQSLPFGPPWDTIPHMFFPAVWADEEASLDEALVDEIKSKLITPLKYVKIGKWTVVGVGCFLIISGAGYFTYLMMKN